jgi:hypothetical protein
LRKKKAKNNRRKTDTLKPIDYLSLTFTLSLSHFSHSLTLSLTLFISFIGCGERGGKGIGRGRWDIKKINYIPFIDSLIRYLTYHTRVGRTWACPGNHG